MREGQPFKKCGAGGSRSAWPFLFLSVSCCSSSAVGFAEAAALGPSDNDEEEIEQALGPTAAVAAVVAGVH
jgi:hypothetical protein